MNINEAFATFNSRIIPPDGIFGKARDHCEYIKRLLSNDRQLSPRKYYYSGSYAKNTCIAPLKDIDLVPYYDIEMCLKPNGDFYNPGTILGKFYQRLQQTFSSTLIVRRQKRSIGIRFTDFDVELVPVFWDGNSDHLSYIADREQKKWIITSIPKHIDFLKGRDRTYRPYGKTIRLAKAWKLNKSVPLKGFALELIVVKSLDTLGTSSHFGRRNFFNVIQYIHENRFNDVIWFDDYYSNGLQIDRSPLAVVDPVNPRNNVTSDVSNIEKRKILLKSDKAYKQAKWALEAEERGDIRIARERWRNIFGPKFPIR
jgi:hypothetical protein